MRWQEVSYNNRQKSFDNIFDSAIKNLPSKQRIMESLALAWWERVVGEQAAEASEAESVHDGVLYVRTKSSVWSNELHLLKEYILKELNRRIGGNLIHDIVFRSRGMRKKVVSEDEKEYPSENELETIALTTEDIRELKLELLELKKISDEDLQKHLEVRITRNRKLRRWRLNHGWKICSRCTAVYKEKEDICPICRLCRNRLL
jgi:predicted nucleic acid-binding Zn ribbon protein